MFMWASTLYHITSHHISHRTYKRIYRNGDDEKRVRVREDKKKVVKK